MSSAQKQGGGVAVVLGWLCAAMIAVGLVLPSPGPTPAAAQARSYAANRLFIPSIHVRAPVVPIQMDASGALIPPSDYREAGWWDGSATAGARHGQTLITAHTVHTGGGAFDRLGHLQPGRRVFLSNDNRRVTYLVAQVEVLTKAQLAQQAQDLFGQGRHPGRLVLVTCTGWTGSYYTSNIVVFARPVARAPLTA